MGTRIADLLILVANQVDDREHLKGVDKDRRRKAVEQNKIADVLL